MAKLVNKGYTDYFSEYSEDGELVKRIITPVDILSYDNNKYAEIRLPDGTVTEIKRGYLSRDEDLTMPIRAVNWFILGGGKRRDYRPRVKKTSHFVRVPREDKSTRYPDFSTKAAAVRYAMHKAKELGQEIEVWEECRTECSRLYSSSTGARFVVCNQYGYAVQFRNEGRRRSQNNGYLQGNSLRGYGKVTVPRRVLEKL